MIVKTDSHSYPKHLPINHQIQKWPKVMFKSRRKKTHLAWSKVPSGALPLISPYSLNNPCLPRSLTICTICSIVLGSPSDPAKLSSSLNPEDALLGGFSDQNSPTVVVSEPAPPLLSATAEVVEVVVLSLWLSPFGVVVCVVVVTITWQLLNSSVVVVVVVVWLVIGCLILAKISSSRFVIDLWQCSNHVEWSICSKPPRWIGKDFRGTCKFNVEMDTVKTRSRNFSRTNNRRILNGALNHNGAVTIKTFFKRAGYPPCNGKRTVVRNLNAFLIMVF